MDGEKEIEELAQAIRDADGAVDGNVTAIDATKLARADRCWLRKTRRLEPSVLCARARSVRKSSARNRRARLGPQGLYASCKRHSWSRHMVRLSVIESREGARAATHPKARLMPEDIMQWRPIESAPRDGAVEIPLTRGQVTVVDAADLPLVEGRKWQAHSRRDRRGFYAVGSNGVRLHRLLLGVTDSRIVDHIDGDGLNNRRSNLRAGTQSQNCVNRKRTPGPHPRGVTPAKRKWKAYIKYRGKIRHIGLYNTPEEAHAAYLKAARELHGDWMPLPSPPEQNDKTAEG